MHQLEDDLKLAGITRTLRDSKEGTLRILQQRLNNLNRRAESNAEVERSEPRGSAGRSARKRACRGRRQ